MNKRIVFAVLALLMFAGCRTRRAFELPPNMVEVQDGKEWVVTSRYTALRPEPNVFLRESTIPPTTRLTVLREVILLYDDTADPSVAARRRNEHWYKVRYREKKGWISMWDTTSAPDSMAVQHPAPNPPR